MRRPRTSLPYPAVRDGPPRGARLVDVAKLDDPAPPGPQKGCTPTRAAGGGP
jgi:hypothetical protein